MDLKTKLIIFVIFITGFVSANNIVYTIDISTISDDEIVAVLALQGLANREQPQILIEPRNIGGFHGGGYKVADVNVQRDGLVAIAPEILSKYESLESVWMEYYTKSFEYTFQRVSFLDLFNIFSSKYKGVVLYDGSNPTLGIPLATTIAGVKDAIPVTTNLLSKYTTLRIDTIENLISRNFANRLEAQKWLIDNYLQQTNKDFAYSYWNKENNAFTIDYAVAKKIFTFDLSFTSEKVHTEGTSVYAYDTNEAAMLDQIFGYLNPGSIILGWGSSAEYILQARCGDGGHAMICTNSSPNLSLHAAVPVVEKSFTQKRQLTANDVTLENKIYIAFSINEGDTYKSVGNLMNDGAWLHQKRGVIPFNWPINPKLLQIVPALAKYYYESSTNQDYFYAPTSGIGYFDAAYSSPAQRTVYAQKGKEATAFSDMHYMDVWWNDFDGKDQWVKDMGMLGYTSWTNMQRADFSKVIPVIESDLYYNLYSPPTKRKASGMAQYIQEQTKNVSGRPWFVNVYACDPTFAAAVMANLDTTRFKAVCMDEFFLLVNKAKTKLLGRYITKNETLMNQIIADSEDERFTDEFNVLTNWENKFCNYSVENGELIIEPLADNYFTLLVKSNLKLNLTKYPLFAAKVDQYPVNGVNWKIKMYDGATNVELPGESGYQVEGFPNVYRWDITKISNWSGTKTSNIQLVLEASTNEQLQNNIMKYDWIRTYDTYDHLISDISNADVGSLVSDQFKLSKHDSQLILEGENEIYDLKLYSVGGILQRVSKNNKISINKLPTGFYILLINNSIPKKINL